MLIVCHYFIVFALIVCKITSWIQSDGPNSAPSLRSLSNSSNSTCVAPNKFVISEPCDSPPGVTERLSQISLLWKLSLHAADQICKWKTKACKWRQGVTHGEVGIYNAFPVVFGTRAWACSAAVVGSDGGWVGETDWRTGPRKKIRKA